MTKRINETNIDEATSSKIPKVENHPSQHLDELTSIFFLGTTTLEDEIV